MKFTETSVKLVRARALRRGMDVVAYSQVAAEADANGRRWAAFRKSALVVRHVIRRDETVDVTFHAGRTLKGASYSTYSAEGWFAVVDGEPSAAD